MKKLTKSERFILYCILLYELENNQHAVFICHELIKLDLSKQLIYKLPELRKRREGRWSVWFFPKVGENYKTCRIRVLKESIEDLYK